MSIIGVGPGRLPTAAHLLLALVLVAQIAAWCGGVLLTQPDMPTAAIAVGQHEHSHDSMCDSPPEAAVPSTIGESRRLDSAASPELRSASAAQLTPVSGPVCAPVIGPPGAWGPPSSGRSLLTSLGIARI